MDGSVVLYQCLNDAGRNALQGMKRLLFSTVRVIPQRHCLSHRGTLSGWGHRSTYDRKSSQLIARHSRGMVTISETISDDRSPVDTVEVFDSLLRAFRTSQFSTGRRNRKMMPAVLWILSRCSKDEINSILVSSSSTFLLHNSETPGSFKNQEAHRSSREQKRLTAALLIQRSQKNVDMKQQLFDLLSHTRVDELSVPSKCVLIKAVQARNTRSAGDEEFIVRLLLHTKGHDLTELKNLLMSGGTTFNLQRLVFSDLSLSARTKALTHFQSQVGERKHKLVKVLSDIDDTIFSVVHDRRYPLNIVYPGVKSFLDELEIGYDNETCVEDAHRRKRLEHIHRHILLCMETLSSSQDRLSIAESEDLIQSSGWGWNGSDGQALIEPGQRSISSTRVDLPALIFHDDLFRDDTMDSFSDDGETVFAFKQERSKTPVAVERAATALDQAILSRELTLEDTHRDDEDKNDIAFLTARPRGWRNVVTALTRRRLNRSGVALDATVLTGSLKNLFNHKHMAAKKFSNFEQFCNLFPEYDYVLIGDAGQGDARLGAMAKEHTDRMQGSGHVRGVFIHNINENDETGDGGDKEVYRNEHGIKFFRNYMDAAIQAYRLGLIGKGSLLRIAESTASSLCIMDFGKSENRRAMHKMRLKELAEDITAAMDFF